MSHVCTVPRRSRHSLLYTWLPAMCAIAAICVESTNSMGLTHTNAMLADVVRWTGHTPHAVDPFNRLFRKLGHFSGYGLLGVAFARGWLMRLSGRPNGLWKSAYLRAGVLGAACACLVASCDEFHQRFLPSRQASVHDVFLDTCGAITLIAAAGLFALRRQAMERLVASNPLNGSYSMQGPRPAYGAS